MNINVFAHKGSFLDKAGSVFVTLSMISMSFAGVALAPNTAHAAANYVISGSLTLNGLNVTASGIASANTFTGPANQQYISVDWGDPSAWVVFMDETDLNFTNNSNNGIIADTPWSTSHTYSAPGSYTIRVSIHHANQAGNEGGLSTFIQTVEVVYQCDDGVDNDGDGLIDYPADPGCSGLTDDDEFNVVPGTLSVIKNVVITGGGTATADQFPISVKQGGVDVTGSPAAGSETGTEYTLTAGSYTVSEPANAHYTTSFGDDCAPGGTVTVVSGTTVTCVVTNTYFNTFPTPVSDQASTTPEDVGFSGAVTAIDAEGDVLTYAIVTGPTNSAAFTLNSNGTFSYTPALNYNGPDGFTFSVADLIGSNSGSFSITVTPVNDDPDAVNDSANVNEDSVDNVIDVLANDLISPDTAETLTVQSVGSASNGTATLDAGSVKYTPNAGYVGSDSFTYTISDDNGGTDTATVNVTVSNTNDAPNAVADAYSVNEDATLSIAAPGVLGNDTDADGDTMTAVLDTDVSNGILTLSGDGSFDYAPDANFNGSDSFTYHVNDTNSGLSGSVTVTITVNPVNDAPVSTGQSITTDQNIAVPGVLGATDVDGDPLTFATTSNPSNGSITFLNVGTGQFTYTPNLNFSGSDSFTFKANDSSVDSNESTVSITVNPLTENTLAECSDGIDNDNDDGSQGGGVDLEDADCAPFIPTLTIVKNTVGGNGTFTFNVQGMETDVEITTEGGAGSETVALDIDGSSSVSENQAQGWDFTSLVCVIDSPLESDAAVNYDGSFAGFSNLIAGDDITCTFVNTIIPTGSDIAVTKEVDDATPDNGQNVTFTITVSNSGPATASGVSVTDNLPSGLTYVSDNGEGDYATSTGVWTIGSLAANATTSLQIVATVTASAGTEVTNTAVSSHENAETNDANDDGSVVIKVNTPVVTTPTPPRTTGGGGTDFGNPTFGPGQVLGTSTGQVLGASCAPFLRDYLRISTKNDPEEVKKLQTFLNEQMKISLPITGVFGPMTDKAVRDFQASENDGVLKPWVDRGLLKQGETTGYVYKTTKRWINMLKCSSLNIPLPPLP